MKHGPRRQLQNALRIARQALRRGDYGLHGGMVTLRAWPPLNTAGITTTWISWPEVQPSVFIRAVNVRFGPKAELRKSIGALLQADFQDRKSVRPEIANRNEAECTFCCFAVIQRAFGNVCNAAEAGIHRNLVNGRFGPEADKQRS